MLVIFDIDGTMADSTHRSHFVDGPVKDWASFLDPALVGKDSPIPGAQKALKHFRDMGFRIIFLTGRNETIRDTTRSWLGEHFEGDHFFYELIMRPKDNLDLPTVYKAKELAKLGKVLLKSGVWLCFDDDFYMQKVYLEYGGVPFLAPGCWSHMFNVAQHLPPEGQWRK